MYTVPSRVTDIDIDKCLTNSNNNRFSLILAAARRTRELSKKNNDPYARITAIDGVLDIQNGVINPNDYVTQKNR
jgi:DNA-directed RNA polymerase omega subunit